MTESVALHLDQSAERLGGYRFIEHRLFELTGSWAASLSMPAVQIHLDEVSAQHAWHAELWTQRIPVLDRIDPDALTLPRGATEALLSALVAGDGGSDDRIRSIHILSGLYRVVIPRLIASYGEHARRAVPVADGATIRALHLVIRDESEAAMAGEALLQGLLTGADDVARASKTQHELEAAVVASAGGVGIFPWED